MTGRVNIPDTVRQSIQPTYDHRATGDRFRVTTRVNGRHISTTTTSDAFIYHRVTISRGDLFRSFLRGRCEVVVALDADKEIVEDIMELNDDYAGSHGSTRRQEWQEHLERTIREIRAL